MNAVEGSTATLINVCGASYSGTTMLPYVSVDYGHLVRSPADQLSTICGRIGMDYHAGKEAFWRRQHHLFGNDRTRRQVAAGHSRIEAAEPAEPEFVAQWAALARQVADDRRVGRVLRQLRLRQASMEPAPCPQPSALPRPLWRGRGAVRRLLLWSPRHPSVAR